MTPVCFEILDIELWHSILRNTDRRPPILNHYVKIILVLIYFWDMKVTFDRGHYFMFDVVYVRDFSIHVHVKRVHD